MRISPMFCQRILLVILLITAVAVAYPEEGSTAQLSLTWTDNSNDEDGFDVERKQGSAGTFAYVATVGPDITSYIDTDASLSDDTSYCYRVSAFNSSGSSDYSNEDCATTPPAPATISVRTVGTGNGTITSSPAGINCGTDCSESYDRGRVVALNATPASSSVFLGWSGGDCNVSATCMLTMNSSSILSATFSSIKFSNNPLTANVSVIQAIHFREALKAINLLRSINGLASINFTAPSPAPGVAIQARHIAELQTGLNAIYDVLGRTRPIFDSIVPGVTMISIRHMVQIRNAILDVEWQR